MEEDPILIICCLGKKTKILPQGWRLISSIKHTDLDNQFENLVAAIQEPDFIIQSKHDDRVYLYYLPVKHQYIVAVIRHYNGDAFLITAYHASKAKGGKTIYEKNK